MLDDETTISAALLAKIEKSRKDIKAGKGKTCRSVDELNAYLEKLWAMFYAFRPMLRKS